MYAAAGDFALNLAKRASDTHQLGLAAVQNPGPLRIGYWSIAVIFRFGTYPTGIQAISFIVLRSTTTTSFVTDIAT